MTSNKKSVSESVKNLEKPVDLTPENLKEIHNLMVQGRVLEERLVKMSKMGEGYFWIGGPGEEAFNVALGLLVDKGHGPDKDFIHLHYRNSALMLALGAPPIDAIRQMKNVETDPYSGGRNFVNHYAKPEWNVVPVSSCIEPQHSQAIGTAHAQSQGRGKGISVVIGGDAGTAEGDFATALVWASRPVNPLPLLVICTNNYAGISTPYSGQHGETEIADRGRAFNVESRKTDGNDVWNVYEALQTAINYVRKERKPYLLELDVSRLHGHSSASGANRVTNEADCVESFEKELEKIKILSPKEMDKIREDWQESILNDLKQVRTEPGPDPHSIFDHVYADKNGDKGRDTLAAQIGLDYAADTAAHFAAKKLKAKKG